MRPLYSVSDGYSRLFDEGARLTKRIRNSPQAYSLLKDPEKRAKYDAELSALGKKKADDLKADGNSAFKAGDFALAISLYSQAILMDASNHVYYSNRSMSYAAAGRWEESRVDAEKCLSINDKYLKGHFNLCRACFKLGDLDKAAKFLARALHQFPGEADLLKLKGDVNAAFESGGRGPEGRRSVTPTRTVPQALTPRKDDPLVTRNSAAAQMQG
jgi:tetratricopeptide (TPR) repeat protein